MSKMSSSSIKVKPSSSSDSDSDSGRISPDSQCSICLGRLQSKSFSDSCLHNFCFQCLVKWSKVKPECPLCKQPFKSIIHNVRSSMDYDQYVVPRPEPVMEPTLVLSDIMSYRLIMEVYSNGYSRELPIMPIHPRPSQPYTGRQSRSTLLRRRSSIYQTGQYIRRLGDPRRESNPHFYRANPDQLERLRPWIERELEALGHRMIAVPLTDQILDALTRMSMRSPEFKDLLAPDLGHRLNHFLHELETFATSIYDMAGFDENAEYGVESSALRSLRRNRWGGPFSASGAWHTPYASTSTSAATAAAFLTPSTTTLDDSDIEIVEVSRAQNRNAPVTGNESVIVLDSDTDVDVEDLIVETRPPPTVLVVSSDEELRTRPSTSKSGPSRKSASSSSLKSTPGTSGTSSTSSRNKRRRDESTPPTTTTTSDSDSEYEPVVKRKSKKNTRRIYVSSDEEDARSSKRKSKSSRSSKRTTTTTITIVEESLPSLSRNRKKKSDSHRAETTRRRKHRNHFHVPSSSRSPKISKSETLPARSGDSLRRRKKSESEAQLSSDSNVVRNPMNLRSEKSDTDDNVALSLLRGDSSMNDGGGSSLSAPSSSTSHRRLTVTLTENDRVPSSKTAMLIKCEAVKSEPNENDSSVLCESEASHETHEGVSSINANELPKRSLSVSCHRLKSCVVIPGKSGK